MYGVLSTFLKSLFYNNILFVFIIIKRIPKQICSAIEIVLMDIIVNTFTQYTFYKYA